MKFGILAKVKHSDVISFSNGYNLHLGISQAREWYFWIAGRIVEDAIGDNVRDVDIERWCSGFLVALQI